MTGPQGMGVLVPNIQIGSGGIGGGGSEYDEVMAVLDAIWYSEVSPASSVEWLTLTELLDEDAATEAPGYGGIDYFDAWFNESGEPPLSYDIGLAVIGDMVWYSGLDELSTNDMSVFGDWNSTTTVGGNLAYVFTTTGMFWTGKTSTWTASELFGVGGGAVGGRGSNEAGNGGSQHGGGGGGGNVEDLFSVGIEDGALITVLAAAAPGGAQGSKGADGFAVSIVKYDGSTTYLLAEGGSGGGGSSNAGTNLDGKTGSGSGGGGAGHAALATAGTGGAGHDGGNAGTSGSQTPSPAVAGGGGGAGGNAPALTGTNLAQLGGPGIVWEGTEYGRGGAGHGQNPQGPAAGTNTGNGSNGSTSSTVQSAPGAGKIVIVT